MKKCPACNQVFSDDNSFCLIDGSTLMWMNTPNETLPSPSTGSNAPTEFIPTHGTTAQTQTSTNSIPGWVYLITGVLATAFVATLAFVSETALTDKNNQSEITKTSERTAEDKSEQNKQTTVSSPMVENQTRYVVSACNSIQDTRTRLEWFIGIDKNVTWYEAQEWISTLNSCGGGWRMPTISEIRTLYNPSLQAGKGYYTEGRYFPAHIDPVFNAIGGGSWVWASQQPGGGNAHSFNLNQGKAVEYSATNKLYSTRAFAVRPMKN